MQLVQLLSTWWNAQWPPPGTSSDELLVGMGPRCLFPKYGKARSYVWITTPLGVHDANQRDSDIDHIAVHTSCIFPHGRPIVHRPNCLQGESSSPNMTCTNAFMELCHDARTLIHGYAGEDRMSVRMSEQFSIYQGIPAWVLLNHLSLYRFCWEHPISKVMLIWCHLGFAHVELTNV